LVNSTYAEVVKLQNKERDPEREKIMEILSQGGARTSIAARTDDDIEQSNSSPSSPEN